jgi:hypothetical protein
MYTVRQSRSSQHVHAVLVVIYLSGCIREDLPEELGVMVTPIMGNKLPPKRIWASDNGCFSQPGLFDPVAYLGWLVRRHHASDRCLFATAPDVVGDAKATLKRSLPFLPIIRAIGFKAAFVGQDGLTIKTTPWDEFDALFIGGTDDFKLSTDTANIVAEAKQRGKWVHNGRVNSLKRLLYSARIGCDSADGTFIAFGPSQNIPRVKVWLAALEAEGFSPRPLSIAA